MVDVALADLLEQMSSARMGKQPELAPPEINTMGPVPSRDVRPDAPANTLQSLLPLLAARGGNPGRGTQGTGGKPMGWIREALQLTNSPMAWRDELYDLMMRESGGNPRAYNDTPVASGQHAQGLFQTIPSTFQAHNMPRLGGIYDPVANAVAAINYIKGRYGTPMNLPTSGGY